MRTQCYIIGKLAAGGRYLFSIIFRLGQYCAVEEVMAPKRNQSGLVKIAKLTQFRAVFSITREAAWCVDQRKLSAAGQNRLARIGREALHTLQGSDVCAIARFFGGAPFSRLHRGISRRRRRWAPGVSEIAQSSRAKYR